MRLLPVLLLAACGYAPSTATVTFRVTNIPPATQAVSLSTQPYDSCFALPKRYAPQAVANLALLRRCFLGDETILLDAWTYDADCCIRSRAEVRFAGDVNPGSRELDNLVVDVPLAPLTTVDCRPGLMCGPET